MKSPVKIVILVLSLLFVVESFFLYRTSKNLIKLHNELDLVRIEDSSGVGGSSEQFVEPIQDVKEGNYLFPLLSSEYYLTSPYGKRVSPILEVWLDHQGVDIGGPWKCQIQAVAKGVVIESWPPPDGYFKGHPTFGGYIVLQHEDGSISKYAHLSSSYVKEGQAIEAGTVIGRMGSTGRSTGQHLHFELEIEGSNVNPLLYIGDPTN